MGAVLVQLAWKTGAIPSGGPGLTMVDHGIFSQWCDFRRILSFTLALPCATIILGLLSLVLICTKAGIQLTIAGVASWMLLALISHRLIDW
jgi:hypothetical protein